MFPSVTEFLQKINTLHPIQAVALGNPAGDADSLISAIASAYIDTVLQETPTLPLLSIPLVDLQTQRPETKYLLQIAGVTQLDVLKDLFQEDHLLATPLAVTLVDHNQLTLPAPVPWKVHAIYDHHYDEGAHLDTCGLLEEATATASTKTTTNTDTTGTGTPSQRFVAFDADTSSALVASTCTLLVERWRRLAEAPIPPSLAILLYGVILLDSINLLPQAGKVTPRDQAAVQYLQTETQWDLTSASSLPQELQSTTHTFPDPTKLFDTLQNQKFHPDFWAGLTAAQALRLDFKSFSASTSTTSSTVRSFGVSTVLQPMKVFLTKPGIWEAMAQTYCLPPPPAGDAPVVDFFGIMFTSIQDGVPERQLLLASLNQDRLVSLVEFLESNGFLQIHGIDWHSQETPSGELHVVQMEQGNTKASRKQVAPVLMDYYKQQPDAAKL